MSAKTKAVTKKKTEEGEELPKTGGKVKLPPKEFVSKKPKAGKEAPPPPMLANASAPNDDAMRKALGIFGEATTGDTGELLARLRTRLDVSFETVKIDDRLKCDKCNEVSTEETDFCPFCGHGGAEGEAPEDVAEVGDEDANGPAPSTNDDGDEGPLPVVVQTPPMMTEEEAVAALDAAESRIREVSADLRAKSWDIGAVIRDVRDRELWKARGFTSFTDWCNSPEIELGRAQAYRLIETTEEYDRQTFEKIGSTKLALISSIKDRDTRDEALSAAGAGASTKDIQRIKSKPEAGAEGGKKAPAKQSDSGSKTPPKKSGNTITLATKVNGKPVAYSFRSATSGKPLKAHTDDAYAEVELGDDVVQRIGLKIDANGKITGVTVAFVAVEK